MKRIVVIGAGIVGLCSAYSLHRRGYSVTVVERDPTLGESCSFGNGGIVVPSHFIPLAAPGMIRTGLKMLLDGGSPFGVERLTDLGTLAWMAQFAGHCNRRHLERSAPRLAKMHLQSRALYEKMLPEIGGDVGYERNGLMMLTRTEAAHRAEIEAAQMAKSYGLGTAVLNADEVRAKEPGLDIDTQGGVWFEDDAHLSPPRTMRALASYLERQGVELRLGTEALGLRREGNRIVALRTRDGAVEGEEFVLAAGVWSPALARSLGVRLPIWGGRGYGLTVPDPPQPVTVPAILVEARIAVTPMPDGVRFVGTMELGAPVPRPPSPRLEAMRRNVAGYLPAYTREVMDQPAWSGFRPCTPSGMPILERARAASNLIIASGHAMMGMSLGPISGEIVGDLCAASTL